MKSKEYEETLFMLFMYALFEILALGFRGFIILLTIFWIISKF